MSIFRAITMPVAVLAGVAIAVTPAGQAHAATWSVVTTPNASTGQNLFIGVDALNTTNVWAVGRADHAPQQPFVRPLAARAVDVLADCAFLNSHALGDRCFGHRLEPEQQSGLLLLVNSG